MVLSRIRSPATKQSECVRALSLALMITSISEHFPSAALQGAAPAAGQSAQLGVSRNEARKQLAAAPGQKLGQRQCLGRLGDLGFPGGGYVVVDMKRIRIEIVQIALSIASVSR